MTQFLTNLTGSEVLVLIDPADPDNLQEFTPGIWTAKWSALGVPSLDRFTIDSHDRLQVVKDWYAPPNLPGWRAIDFRVLADTGVDHG